ncbi:rubrerythrin [Bradyrhizobium ottawaense]
MPFLRTSLLSAEPAGVLESLDELFALAHAMEQEAANRYESLAQDMRGQGKADLAEVFTKLAAAEREHVDSVTQWSQSRRGKSPDPALVRWEAPEALAPEAAAEVKTSRLMTPYRALAMAVRNEERAFAFWSYLAAYSKDPDIKRASEAMAREELGHVATLRKERRRAYHHEHERSSADASTPRPPQIDARRLELRLIAQLGDIERRLSGPAARSGHGTCANRRSRWPTPPRASAAFRPPWNERIHWRSPKPWSTATSTAPSGRATQPTSKACSTWPSARSRDWPGCDRLRRSDALTATIRAAALQSRMAARPGQWPQVLRRGADTRCGNRRSAQARSDWQAAYGHSPIRNSHKVYYGISLCAIRSIV